MYTRAYVFYSFVGAHGAAAFRRNIVIIIRDLPVLRSVDRFADVAGGLGGREKQEIISEKKK